MDISLDHCEPMFGIVRVRAMRALESLPSEVFFCWFEIGVPLCKRLRKSQEESFARLLKFNIGWWSIPTESYKGCR